MIQRLFYELNNSDKDIWLKDVFHKTVEAIEKEECEALKHEEIKEVWLKIKSEIYKYCS